MTTRHSPLVALKAQADRIAASLKVIANDPSPTGKIKAAIERGELVFGIVMDDQLVRVFMPVVTIRSLTAEAISVWIVAHMQGATRN